MYRIAILIEGNIEHRGGLVNAAINRALYLKRIADFDVDFFCLQRYPGGLNRIFRESPSIKANSLLIDGLDVQLLWYKRYAIDDLLSNRMSKRPLFFRFTKKRVARKLKNYNLLVSHNVSCSGIAELANKKCGIPYVITWHGSDIHSLPSCSDYLHGLIIKLLRGADMNIFVSEFLSKRAAELAGDINSEVLYNGVNSSFVEFSEVDKHHLREKYGVDGKKVVAFVGNLVPVKNIQSLPHIFKKVIDKYGGDLVFWIIGDGHLRSQLQKDLSSLGINAVLWGSQNPSKMPSLYNCIDVLVLPSLNEGLSLVTLEAMKCGANVVGSKVGGVVESIGEDNAFDLDDCFYDNIANRIVYYCNNNVKQIANPEFSWEVTAQKERSIYKRILER